MSDDHFLEQELLSLGEKLRAALDLSEQQMLYVLKLEARIAALELRVKQLETELF